MPTFSYKHINTFYERINKYKEKYNLSFNVYSLDFLMQINSRNLSFFEPELVEDKEGFFLSHNRSVTITKSHRYALLIYLKKYGILDDTDWSLLMGGNLKDMHCNNDITYFYRNILNEDEL